MIAVVDYGMGNLGSVAKALEFLGAKVRRTSDPKVVGKAKAVVFPGVGAFGQAMQELRARRLVDPIVDSIQGGKPFLGLCLGLQLLFDSSEESPGVRGLRILPGRVRRLTANGKLKVPHMGWNQIEKQLAVDSRQSTDSLLDGVPDGAYMYFVHSYYVNPQDKGVIAATTEYGRRFPSVVWNGGRLWATQFHPEKSQKWGLKILSNFLSEVQ